MEVYDEREDYDAKFVLNTKSKCFLCLKHVVQQQQQKEPIIIKVNGSDEDLTCNFVKVEQEYSPPPPPLLSSCCPVESHQSLLSIVRYLKIQWKKILTTFEVEHGGIVNSADFAQLERIPDISVTLCCECSVVTSQLSNLCRELQLLQMKVDHQLKCFHGIVQRSEEDVALFQEFWQDVLTPCSTETMEMSHGDLAGILRDEIKNKCNAMESNALPRVMIPRKKSNTIKYSPLPINTTCDNPTINVGIGSIIAAVLGADPQHVNCARCHHRPIPVAEYERHNIRYHMETLLCQYKLLHVSNLEFKEYCDYVFQVEMLLCQVQGENPDSFLKCSNCSKVYTNNFSLRHHLFTEHGQLLGKKLGELQRSTTLEEIRSTQLPSSLPPVPPPMPTPSVSHSTGVVPKKTKNIPRLRTIKKKRMFGNLPAMSVKDESCQLCIPQSDIKYRNLKHHIVRAHAESLFTSYQLFHLSSTEFKQYCEHIIQVELLSCEKKYTSDGTPFRRCSYCSKRMTNLIVLRAHLVLEHQEIISQKLVELQNSTTPAEIEDAAKNLSSLKRSSGWTCIKCGSKFSQETTLYRHRKLECPFRVGGRTSGGIRISSSRGNFIQRRQRRVTHNPSTSHVVGHYVCQDCGESFPTRQQKWQHRKKYHPDKMKRTGKIMVNDHMEFGDFVEETMYPKVDMETLNYEEMGQGPELGLDNETFPEQFNDIYQQGDFKQQHEAGFSPDVDQAHDNTEMMMVNNKMTKILSDDEDPLQQ